MTSDQAVFINFRKLDFEAHAIETLHSYFGKSGLEATFLDTAGLN